MVKHEFEAWVLDTFTPTELALINPNIYLNPKHIDYYETYHRGNYEECKTFLLENRHLLKLEHTPYKFRKVARQQIKAVKKLLSS